MDRYSVFGGCLQSAVPFPELRPLHDGTPDWTLQRIHAAAGEVAAELLGEDRADVDVGVRLFRIAEGFRLAYDDTGSGIAFLAPKLHGKSTLAQAMVAAGARMASDDVVPVYGGAPARMAPGVPSARLWSDSLGQLGIRSPARSPSVSIRSAPPASG